MVSFSCESCQDTIKKPKLEQHLKRCRNAMFTCIDCYQTFQGNSYKSHSSCISEEQKVQKTIYQPKKKNTTPNKNYQSNETKNTPSNDTGSSNIAKQGHEESIIDQIKKRKGKDSRGIRGC